MSTDNGAKVIDLTDVLKPEHSGKWVALSRNRRKVLSVGEDMLAASELAKRGGNSEFVLMLVPDFDKGFVPHSQI